MQRSMETWLAQPDLADISVATVLAALADPIRLQIVKQLDADGEGSCTTLKVPVKHSTVSHHLRLLRDSGITSTRLVGNARLSRLRRSDLEQRFPGLLSSVLEAAPPRGERSPRTEHQAGEDRSRARAMGAE